MALDDHGITEDDELDYTGLDVSDDLDLDLDPVADMGEHHAGHMAPEEDEGIGAYSELVGAEDTGHIVERPADARRIPSMVGGILCAAAAVVCVALFVYMLFLKPSGASHILGLGGDDDSQSLSDNRSDVLLPVYVPELDSKGSRIPVSVTGTLADGSEYNKDTYVSYDGKGLRLEPGTYELRLSGSPISAGGILYEVPDTVVTVQVGEGLDVSLDPSSSLMFSSIGALNVTDEQIEEAKAFVENDPERTMYAESLAERARTRREDAQREAREAAANLASQQAAAAAAAAAVQEQMQTQGQTTGTETTETTETDVTVDETTTEGGSTNQDEYQGVPWQGDVDTQTPDEGAVDQGGSSEQGNGHQGGIVDTGEGGSQQETTSSTTEATPAG